MRWSTIIWIAAVASAAIAQEKAAQGDVAALQGTWSLISGERDGKKASPEEFKVKLVVKGNEYSFSGGPAIGTAPRGTFKLDETKSPREIDATAAEGPDKGKTFLGIYSVEGDRHKACFAPPGKGRPQKFASTPGSGYLFQTWKRDK